MFHHDTGTLPVSAVVALSNALRNALAVVPNLPFKLQLEMDRPKS